LSSPDQKSTSGVIAELLPFLGANLRLGPGQLTQLLERGQVLEYKYFGSPSIVRIEGMVPMIVKLWHPKPGLSSDRLFPYSNRFRKNARLLRERNLAAPKVVGWGVVEPGRIRFVTYQEIAGQPLREVCPDIDLDGFARYLVELHDSVVDFRSLHLGNVLQCAGAGYGLIDVTDCSFRSRPLAMRRRMKCLSRMCGHGQDTQYFSNGRWSDLVSAYCRAMNIGLEATTRVLDHVRDTPGKRPPDDRPPAASRAVPVGRCA
jgi:hypothetical protein